jgi:hypothetical protein
MSHFSPFVRRKPRWKHLTIGVGVLALSLLPSLTWTQQAGFPSIYYPAVPAEKQWQVSVGFVQVTPPKELTEEAWVRAPAFDAHALYGLSPEFALDGRLLSQFVQNHLSVGGRWAHSMGNFAVGAGYDVAYWFGFLNVGGFDSKAHGWMNYPSVTVGYKLGDVRLIGKGEAWLDLYHKTSVGDNEVATDGNKLVGASFTIAMEQAFYKNTQLTLGFRGTFTKFHWMTWSLFSTFDRYLFYPEIIIGFIL